MQDTKIKYNPSQAIIKNAQIGKALTSKYKRNPNAANSSNSESNKNLLFSYDDLIEKANNLCSKEELDLAEVKDLYFKLQTLEKGFKIKEVKTDGGPTDSTLGFMLCGGNAGLSWCRKILKSENILKSYRKEITEEQINTPEDAWFTKVEFTKSVNEELMQATYIVLEPNVIDVHGDTYDEETVRKACHNFNQHCKKANLFHLVDTDGFTVVESYTTPIDIVLEDQYIAKGTWLCVLQYNDEELWDLAKSGEIQGVSIGGKAHVQYLDTEEE